MDDLIFVKSLAKSVHLIESICKDISAEQAVWKPEPKKWSIIEVVNHLYDEERLDFRKRFKLTLQNPGKAWPGIDPLAWVSSHQYNQKNLSESLQKFISERNRSLKWLHSLSTPDLNQQHHHPQLGSISAGDLLAAWAAHDYLHIRQIATLESQYLNINATPFSTRYANP
jgi:hypothetical protein